MDDVLIRRLLGGVVLIAVAWLVAALLPPPKPVTERDENTVVIDLRPVEVAQGSFPASPEDDAGFDTPFSSAAPVPVTPVVSPMPTTTTAAPVTAPRDTPVATPARTVPVTPSATPRPSIAPTPASTPAPVAAGQFWVQVGAYGTRENAEQVREKLGVAGLAARVISAEVGGRQIHRVRIGPFKARAEADSAHARAVLLGYSNAQVVGT